VCAARAGVRPAPAREVVVRAALAALAVSYPGGWVAAQYVHVQYMSLLWPMVLGLAASWAAAAAAGSRDRSLQLGVLAVAAGGALLGTALGFRIFDTPVTPLHPWKDAWGPYLAAVGGVLAWPLAFGVPRRGARVGQDAGANR
jgi:hypothetical protein